MRERGAPIHRSQKMTRKIEEIVTLRYEGKEKGRKKKNRRGRKKKEKKKRKRGEKKKEEEKLRNLQRKRKHGDDTLILSKANE